MGWQREWVLGLLLVCACTPAPPLPPDPVAQLSRNPACVASLPRFGYFDWVFYPPLGTMTSGPGGGWCWVDPVFTVLGTLSRNDESIPVPATLTVLVPPQHGEVMLGPVGKGYRIAYRPWPGFAGIDSFHIHVDEVYHLFDIPMSVTVAP